jgi:hypothetical protein
VAFGGFRRREPTGRCRGFVNWPVDEGDWFAHVGLMVRQTTGFAERMIRTKGIGTWLAAALALAVMAAWTGCQGPAPAVPPDGEPRRAGAAETAAGASDAFVILTGGGTPLSNEYSHYLQARAMSDYFRQRYPAEAVWTFFGIGNRDGAPGILADVHKQTRKGERLVDTWLPGSLPENRPATKEGFLKALREEILPRVAGGGTLYLFVGDHGELTPGKNAESAVTMWQLRRGRKGRGWDTDRNGILTVSDLRAALAAGLGRGRVVFCMTQCHAGGFHFMGVPRAPALATGPLLRVAGFTATDEASVASGCVADPDPVNWEGYERFIPQALLGRDLMTGARLGLPTASFAAAHEAATLVDRTIDKPYGSSDQFLAGWADHIETTLLRTLDLTDTEVGALASYTRAVDGQPVALAGDAALALRADRFRRFTAMWTNENPTMERLLNRGTRKELEAALAVDEAPAPAAGGGRRRGGAPTRRLWTETIRPAWKAAVAAGREVPVPAAAMAFEKRVLELEDGGRDFLSSTNREKGLLNEVYWESGFSEPVVKDRAKSEAVARWGGERRQRILEWATTHADAPVREAAATIARAQARAEARAPEPAGPIEPTAVERVLFYRRVVAAWNFLLATNNRAALAQLAAINEVENTPLPEPTRAANGRVGQ